MNTPQQVKSKKRVVNHGEVFTADREVNAMLDLVKQETERIDSRFLEPACGSGNFLVAILKRKLEVVGDRYKKNQLDYERYAVVAVSSIYGVDLLEDNVAECRERLFKIVATDYQAKFKSEPDNACLRAIKFILSKNILCGDALTMLKNDSTPIVFAEWALVRGSLFKRRDFSFDELLRVNDKQMTLSQIGLKYDDEEQAFIPEPIREFPLTHFGRLHEYE